MQTPIRKKFTRELCKLLANCGFLPKRYELVDGKIISKMSKEPSHARYLKFIASLLISLFGANYVRSQKSIDIRWRMGAINEPVPDLVVLDCPLDAFQERNPLPEEIVFLVEIADSSLEFDLRDKALLYAKSGILDCWVMDLNARVIVVHRGLSMEGYKEIVLYKAEDTLSPLSHPEISIRVCDLMPRPRVRAVKLSGIE